VSVDYAVVQTTKQSIDDSVGIPSVPVPTAVFAGQSRYWMIDNNNSSKNVVLGVTDDSYSDEVENEVLQIIGRGRKQDLGTDWGITGTLTAQVYGTPMRTAAQIRDVVIGYQKSEDDIYLRNPFGQVIKVSVGQVTFDRIAGGGQEDFASGSIPYQAIS
jgi:hypothetical protein